MESTDFKKIIAQFAPFDTLEAQLFEQITRYIEPKVAKKGAQLFEVGDNDADEYYLLSGKLGLIAKDGRERLVSAGEPAAKLPIARLRPRMYTAKASTDIRYFSVSKSVMDELQRSVSPKDQSLMVDDMREQAGEDGHILLHEFKQELSAGRFSLPSLPEIALRIREKIEDPEVSIADIAALVNTDPAIAAKLLKTANSPLYRGVSPCKDTQAAISRLGMATTKQLVTSFAVLALFKSDSKSTVEQMRRLWRQSIEVAAFSFVLGKQLPTINEDEAMLAGLLHVVGELVILNFAEQFYDLSTDQQRLDTVMILLSGTIGGMVLEKWDFSEELVMVAREFGDWLRHGDEESDLDYCDLVQIASLYAAKHQGLEGEMPEMHSVPAFNKIALSQEQTDQIFHDADEQLVEVRRLLNGDH